MRCAPALGLAAALVLVAPGSAAADSDAAADDVGTAAEDPLAPRRSVREAFRTFAADGRYLLTFPARTHAKGVWLTAGVAAATALAIGRDEEMRAEVLDTRGRTSGRVSTKLEPLGRYEVEAAALGTFYLIGRGTGRARAVSTAATAFESYLWAGIFTSVAKGAFGRDRPGGDTRDGRFFAGDTIFPSGHTARSFAIAAVFADRYGRGAACAAYPLAALVGLATVEQDRHWVSDVVAGAGLGLAIGKGIASRHPSAPRGPTRTAWHVMPVRGGAVLRVIY